MSDRFYSIPTDKMLEMILHGLKENNAFQHIPRKLFFNPDDHLSKRTTRYQHLLDIPLGVAAGPHSQMAQNIIAAWLCGARYIELKTVQTLDELEVAKPCIDMQDEGYNCEWSQELKIHESFDQYLGAWVIIHILNHKLGFSQRPDAGTIFNMSVGYNLDGILKPNVQWFFEKMASCPDELKAKIDLCRPIYPAIDEIEISSCLSDNITLSTMHGCPPDEIQQIGEYLIRDKGLHTMVKLNPTLLGPEVLRGSLNDQQGFPTNVPDEAFVHDLKYVDAIGILNRLTALAEEKGVHFGVKLTNTLECVNKRNIFPEDQEMMYMSGRSLHPLSVKLAAKLQDDFKGKLDISFSGGANAFNIADLLKSGMGPVTVCTDILKPGGYGLLHQYINTIEAETGKLEDISTDESWEYLKNYEQSLVDNKDYKRTALREKSIKTNRKLEWHDCVSAPCQDTCPTNQDIPDYLYFASQKEFDKSFSAILKHNPFPSVTGMICDHLCQTKCTRINYEGSVRIREVKRTVAESEREKECRLDAAKSNGCKVAIIGAGPAGLSCAFYLRLAGCEVVVYEAKENAGGMVSGAIPSFRLTDKAFENDLERIKKLGVKIEFNAEIDSKGFHILSADFDFVFVGAGAQKSKSYVIDGIDSEGVLDPLNFLFEAKKNPELFIGKDIAILGGGNTAMDAARTAYRLCGEDGNVTIIYRRSIPFMPADQGEIEAVIEEGVEILELTDALSIERNADKLHIRLQKMELVPDAKGGRPRPKAISGSEFNRSFDAFIPATGQDIDFDFLSMDDFPEEGVFYRTAIDNVFLGGDALRGASTAINAIGDGRKTAVQIMKQLGLDKSLMIPEGRNENSLEEQWVKRSQKMRPQASVEIPLDDRKNFQLVAEALTAEEAREEAARCLQCDEFCGICTTVCPNLANYTFPSPESEFMTYLLRKGENGWDVCEPKKFEIKQKYQVLNIADWCNECGNCNTFCPTSGAPYRDKPRFCLTKESYNSEDKAFFGNADMMYFKDANAEYVMKKENGSLFFSSEFFKIEIDAKTFDLICYTIDNKQKEEIDLRTAALLDYYMKASINLGL